MTLTETEDTVAARMIETLLTRTINDITTSQMNRIVQRLNRMSQTDRGIPKRVADVLAEELGPEKALQYVDKALAAGQISMREYDEMRAALIFPMPREEIPKPQVAIAARALVAGHKQLQEDFKRLSESGQAAFRKSVEALDKDVKRIKKSWGIK